MSTNNFGITAQKLEKIRALLDAVKRAKAGKAPTSEQSILLSKLDRENKPRADRWTVTEAANMMAVDIKTVQKGLRELGLEISRAETFLVKDVVRAVYGDEQAERNRNLKLDADRKEREEREAAGKLVDRELMEKHIAEFYTLPLLQALNSLPTTLDMLCNPSDPPLANAALLRWVEETKKLVREKMK